MLSPARTVTSCVMIYGCSETGAPLCRNGKVTTTVFAGDSQIVSQNGIKVFAGMESAFS